MRHGDGNERLLAGGAALQSARRQIEASYRCQRSLAVDDRNGQVFTRRRLTQGEAERDAVTALAWFAGDAGHERAVAKPELTAEADHPASGDGQDGRAESALPARCSTPAKRPLLATRTN